MGRVDIYPTTALQGPPSAQLGYAEVTANQSTITAEVDLTGLAVTVTVPVGRRIKITGHVLARSTVANDVFQLSIKEGATLLNAAKDSVPTTDDLSIDAFSIITPSAGTHTYKLTALRSSGSGNLNIAAGATFPSYILVEDITGTFWNGVPVTNPPACRITNSIALSIPNAAETTITFDTEDYDTDTMHSTSVNTDLITFNTAGIYVLHFNCEFPTNGNGYRYVIIRETGGNNGIAFSSNDTASVVSGVGFSISCTRKFAAGSSVRVRVFQNSTAALNIAKSEQFSPYFDATWIGLG